MHGTVMDWRYIMKSKDKGGKEKKKKKGGC